MYIEFIPTDADVEEIKGIQEIPYGEDKHDAHIKLMLPLMLESVMAYTNNDFGGIQSDGTLRIPGGVKIYLAKAIERNRIDKGIKSRSMGSVSYTYDVSIQSDLKDHLKPYKKVKFNAIRR